MIHLPIHVWVVTFRKLLRFRHVVELDHEHVLLVLPIVRHQRRKHLTEKRHVKHANAEAGPGVTRNAQPTHPSRLVPSGTKA